MNVVDAILQSTPDLLALIGAQIVDIRPDLNGQLSDETLTKAIMATFAIQLYAETSFEDALKVGFTVVLSAGATS